MIIELDWTGFKQFITDSSLSFIYISEPDGVSYSVFSMYQGFTLKSYIKHDTADHTDFEDNYKSIGNSKLADSDGTSLSRIKAATAGWTYQSRNIEVVTSKLTSVFNNDHTGLGWGDAVVKFYDMNDVELTTQNDLDTSCVKTVLDWEPLYDMELIGGSATIAAAPADDVRIWCVGVPDLVPAVGGTKIMVSGINFKFNRTVNLDGRVAKKMLYSATYHTNKMRTILTHPAGEQHAMSIVWEHYKS